MMNSPSKILLEDTRQQPGKHDSKHRYFDDNGVTVRRTKLYVGDYQFADDAKTAVDTKASVLELVQDVTHDHERFRNELIRAQEAGISLVVLIEEKLPYGRLDLWESPRKKNKQPYTKMDGRTLRKILITMQERYAPVRFRFCGKDEAGERVLHYLEGGE